MSVSSPDGVRGSGSAVMRGFSLVPLVVAGHTKSVADTLDNSCHSCDAHSCLANMSSICGPYD
jgi:hypothetical protein